MKQYTILEHAVRTSLDQYFDDLGESEPHDMWEMVIQCVEKPLLEVALDRAEGNQSRAAQMLGITRNTLRKKLLTHKLLDA